jgi:signal transduction histidine kinase
MDSKLSPAQQDWLARLQEAWRTTAIWLRRYADWLAQQTWKQLALLGVLLVAVTGIVSSLPPFSTRWGASEPKVVKLPHKVKAITDAARHGQTYDVTVDDQGVHIRGHVKGAEQAASAVRDIASAVADGASGVAAPPVPPLPAPGSTPALPGVDIKLPPGASTEEIKQAIEDAKDALSTQIEAAADAAEEAQIEVRGNPGFRLGDHLMSLTMLVIVASIIAKTMGAGRKKAEAQAAVATERAESESLRRQVVEARMAAMQAQVEPHFLFNTLASIDHLIETDPARASQMQKNLIALLRASMPTMRETANAGPRPLERELAVIRPYLEILKVRMEERLQTEIDVPEGLLSAEFPPMMVQSLVENAIKHGLEPKAEGGRLTVKAEIRHGKLCVTVADTGLGFGKAATSGTGVGLANIRERLQLLYGTKASLTVTQNQPSGTVVTITVPYTHRDNEGA